MIGIREVKRMGASGNFKSTGRLTVGQMMNTNFKSLCPGDSLKTVVEYYQKYKLSTLPVVDENENLIGVMPRKRLFKALINGEGLEARCGDYMVDKPVFINVDKTYDEYSLVVQVTKSKVDNVVVLDNAGKAVGMIGAGEYLRESLNFITASSALLESLFHVNYEGIVIVDRDGYILRINPAAQKMFGISVNETKGKTIKEVFPEINISPRLCIGLKETIRSLPVIINQVPIIENDEQIGYSFAFLDISDMEKIVSELEIVKKLQTKIDYYRDELEKRDSGNRFDQILTANPAFLKIRREAGLIARSSSTVLITGESGVGKDVFARGIHEASPRAKGPFVKVNCVSIPESLFESELFGYAPGSFTGALKSGKPGYFESAHTGTIFLDEIGDMPMPIQVKLLQVLQEKEFMRVGGTEKQTVDVRIIAATNRDLREAIAKKSFREDLYYRLNVIEFHLPPLRERPEDIIILAKAFVGKYNRILGAKVTGISLEAQEALQNYSWPGNIRELENAVERAANYVWEGEITLENLPSQITDTKQEPDAEPPSYRDTLENFQRNVLTDALKQANGNRSAAARLMNLSRSAFYDRLKKYNII